MTGWWYWLHFTYSYSWFESEPGLSGIGMPCCLLGLTRLSVLCFSGQCTVGSMDWVFGEAWEKQIPYLPVLLGLITSSHSHPCTSQHHLNNTLSSWHGAVLPRWEPLSEVWHRHSLPPTFCWPHWLYYPLITQSLVIGPSQWLRHMYEIAFPPSVTNMSSLMSFHCNVKNVLFRSPSHYVSTSATKHTPCPRGRSAWIVIKRALSNY